MADGAAGRQYGCDLGSRTISDSGHGGWRQVSVRIRYCSIALCAAALCLVIPAAAQAQGLFDLFKPPPPPPPQAAPPPPQRAQPPRAARPQTAPQPAAKSQAPRDRAAAPAPAPSPNAPYAGVRSACASEMRGTCAAVAPGTADAVECLRRNFHVHSPACQNALRQAIAATQPVSMPAEPAGPKGTSETPRRITTDRVAAPEPPSEAQAPLNVPSLRPTQEARFVSRFCREDYSLLCQGVPYGQVLKCLAGHQSTLRADCRKALAARR
jgi:hypothetical protein